MNTTLLRLLSHHVVNVINIVSILWS